MVDDHVVGGSRSLSSNENEIWVNDVLGGIVEFGEHRTLNGQRFSRLFDGNVDGGNGEGEESREEVKEKEEIVCHSSPFTAY